MEITENGNRKPTFKSKHKRAIILSILAITMLTGAVNGEFK